MQTVDVSFPLDDSYVTRTWQEMYGIFLILSISLLL
jgi:hypothetical protein